MTAAGWIALAITIFGAFSYAAASILQAVGAQRSSGTVKTLGHPLYLLGTACDVLAWGGSMIALRELAVYQVQAILAGSLAITVVAARLILASRLRGRDVAAISVTIGALTVLAMSAGPQEAVTASGTLRLGFCAAAVATALIGWGAAKVASPGIVAALAGLAMGGAALAGRALYLPPEPMSHLGAAGLAIVTEPMSGALVLFAATGMLLYTHALQHGDVGPVTAVLWISEVVAPSAVALALLGDTVRPGWELRSAVAGLVTVVAATVLATGPATGDTGELPQPALPPGHRPAALPAREYGTILWWGPQTNPLPIWRPPKRARAATEPTAQPASGRPASGQPARALPMWATPPSVRSPAAPPPALPAAAPWSTARPPRPLAARPEPSRPLPPPDLRPGPTPWEEPPTGRPIWTPPNRTNAT